jgi:hypothetical protein
MGIYIYVAECGIYMRVCGKLYAAGEWESGRAGGREGEREREHPFVKTPRQAKYTNDRHYKQEVDKSIHPKSLSE